MKQVIVKCDRCGDDITPINHCCGLKSSHVFLELEYWHGGSLGGDEDIDKYDLDLCEKCSRQLSSLVSNWLKENKED